MPKNLSQRRIVVAWLVHLYTASGGIIGMLALLAAAAGRTHTAFVLLAATSLIDATDGLLARWARTQEAIPWFSGAQLDNAVDVFTFIWVPIFIMGFEHLLPHPAWLVVPILAALYAYGQVNMKTPDNFFLGFPSYWNIVALYLYWLRPGDFVAVLWVFVPATLSFIPTRYLYPTRNAVLWKTTWGLGVVWAALLVYLLLQAHPSRKFVVLSLFFPLYYIAVSFYLDVQIRRKRGRQ